MGSRNEEVGPARIVFEAFTKAELLKRWWVPKSMGMTLLSCEVDARVGGKYRLVSTAVAPSLPRFSLVCRGEATLAPRVDQ